MELLLDLPRFWVPEQNFEALTKKLEKLSRRALARNEELASIKLAVWDQEMREVRAGQPNLFYQVTVEGELPALGDWQLIAKIDFDPGTGKNVLYKLPIYNDQLEIPQRYRETGTACEHCELKRKRRWIYLLRHVETDEWKQVGSTCLEEFTGSISAADIAALAEYLHEARQAIEAAEENAGYEWNGRWLDRDAFLAYVALVIRERGRYVSRSKSGELGMAATADVAFNMMTKRLLHDRIGPMEADHNQAKQAMEWLKTGWSQLPEEELNDYQHNMVTILDKPYLASKMIGYAASLLPVWYRSTAEQKTKRASEWVGEKGQRQEFINLNLVYTTCFEGYYGLTQLHKFEDQAGNVLVWFSSGCTDLQQGMTYAGRATVADHTVYKNGEEVKQTKLTRCDFYPQAAAQDLMEYENSDIRSAAAAMVDQSQGEAELVGYSSRTGKTHWQYKGQPVVVIDQNYFKRAATEDVPF